MEGDELPAPASNRY